MTGRKRICIGLTAHVDAGKTTLAEAMMYESGQLKKIGRVDHRDSLLDYESFERERGITAFSKQAVLRYGETEFTLIDTPGHAALLPETTRGLEVPDAAVLVISGTEGVQADTLTIWDYLMKEGIPVWLFVSKMDLSAYARKREELLDEMRKKLSPAITDFGVEDKRLMEELASCDETCMDEYLTEGGIRDEAITAAVSHRSCFPCFFGSGLKLEGVRDLLDALDRWSPRLKWPEEFSAFCYKISRDARGQRLTQLKITGGKLAVRHGLRYSDADGELREEKITEIRVYSGARYERIEEAEAGQVCSVLGLTASYAGMMLGEPGKQATGSFEAVRRFTVTDRTLKDRLVLFGRLRQLAEEWPELKPMSDRSGISIALDGAIQEEMFRSMMKERFESDIELTDGRIIYRETVKNKVEGIGHFEPLRHYAEVHLILEPLPEGSGLYIESACPEDVLDRNWQNLILDTLRSNTLPGILTGSELTDMRICLVSGKAHPKHTEGGDFREAVFRALRHGLMNAECSLLEPTLHFALTMPVEEIGRAISDLKMMHASFSTPEQNGTLALLEGEVPASEFGDYPESLKAYTHGEGRISVHPAAYRPCHNSADVIERIGYDPQKDADWPADSVFCAHGGGFSVSWKEVREYMHLPSVIEKEERRKKESAPAVHMIQRIDDRELEQIMLREFGPVKRPQLTKTERRSEETESGQQSAPHGTTLLIDGYNFIFAEPELKNLAVDGLDTARTRLLDRISNYCGVTGKNAVVVFDGYRASGNPGTKTAYANIRVVFTPEGESADAYIERIAAEIGKNESVVVVTGDAMIRVSALRSGVLRMRPMELMQEIEAAQLEMERILERSNLLSHKTQTVNALKKKEKE